MNRSLERIIPDRMDENLVDRDTLLLHLERYHYAGKYLKTGTIADIACGVGYGSYLLATKYGENIKCIYGIDVDAASIDFATNTYHHPLIRFVTEDVFEYRCPELLNNIISLETIEHLKNPHLFIQLISKQLVPGGRFIASVPITPSMDANPYHLNDFTIKSFRQMFISNGFKELNFFIQKQSFNPFSLMHTKWGRKKDLRSNIFSYYLKHPRKFLLRLQSLLYDGFNNKYLVIVFEKL